jgi:hypothetical protein
MANPMGQRARSVLMWSMALLAPLSVHADMSKTFVVYDRQVGELSPGTQAPKLESMMNAIRSASPTLLTATLEYGQHVECMECVPLLEQKLLHSSDPKVREMSAWWLRQRAFGYGRIAVAMRNTVMEDQDPVHRSRAAEALGEFLDERGLPALEHAATDDKVADVRLAAVRALGRLNSRAGQAVITAAFEDADASVRRAAIDQVLRLNDWQDEDAIVARLGDADAQVRMRAAQISGEHKLDVAVSQLGTLLANDESVPVRQAAAWALGRIGGGAAKNALSDAGEHEQDSGVLDAIQVAIRMRSMR